MSSKLSYLQKYLSDGQELPGDKDPKGAKDKKAKKKKKKSKDKKIASAADKYR